jgi:uncharacterized protein YdiU (UPF0061 family)
LFADGTRYDAWSERWHRRLTEEDTAEDERRAVMRRANPAYIPRNHIVEEALSAAVLRQDFQPFETLLGVTSNPFEERPDLERYATPAKPDERVLYTFCGT